MAKDLTVSMLMDFYGQLLTDKQLSALDMYYNEDMSLAEIADEFGISRQGARDNIKRGEKQLSEYEEKLGLAKRFLDISAEIKEMNGIVDTLEGNEDKVNNLKRIFARISLEI